MSTRQEQQFAGKPVLLGARQAKGFQPRCRHAPLTISQSSFFGGQIIMIMNNFFGDLSPNPLKISHD